MAGVGVCWVKSLVVLDVDEDTVLPSCSEERKVVGKKLSCRFCDQDMVFALNGVECDGVVCCVWGKDSDGGVGWKSVDGGLVGVWICRLVRWVAGKGNIDVIVSEGDILVQMVADGRELRARDACHGEG